jgi:uncharacterized protein (DUF1778 family)
MSIPRTGQVIDLQAVPAADSRTIPRAKTVATRLSPEELEEVEAAAKRSGKTLADWLRTVALDAARPIPDTNELLLAEVAAIRYMVLNLFQASATATQNGAHLTPEAVMKIRETADSRKQQTARKLIQDFVAAEVRTGGDRR